MLDGIWYLHGFDIWKFMVLTPRHNFHFLPWDKAKVVSNISNSRSQRRMPATATAVGYMKPAAFFHGCESIPYNGKTGVLDVWLSKPSYSTPNVTSL